MRVGDCTHKAREDISSTIKETCSMDIQNYIFDFMDYGLYGNMRQSIVQTIFNVFPHELRLIHIGETES